MKKIIFSTLLFLGSMQASHFSIAGLATFTQQGFSSLKGALAEHPHTVATVGLALAATITAYKLYRSNTVHTAPALPNSAETPKIVVSPYTNSVSEIELQPNGSPNHAFATFVQQRTNADQSTIEQQQNAMEAAASNQPEMAETSTVKRTPPAVAPKPKKGAAAQGSVQTEEEAKKAALTARMARLAHSYQVSSGAASANIATQQKNVSKELKSGITTLRSKPNSVKNDVKTQALQANAIEEFQKKAKEMQARREAREKKSE